MPDESPNPPDEFEKRMTERSEQAIEKITSRDRNLESQYAERIGYDPEREGPRTGPDYQPPRPTRSRRRGLWFALMALVVVIVAAIAYMML